VDWDIRGGTHIGLPGLLDGGRVIETERDETRSGCCWKTGCDVFDRLLVEDLLSEVKEFEGLCLGRVSGGTNGKGRRTFAR
jgi:hypothetical protein